MFKELLSTYHQFCQIRGTLICKFSQRLSRAILSFETIKIMIQKLLHYAKLDLQLLCMYCMTYLQFPYLGVMLYSLKVL